MINENEATKNNEEFCCICNKHLNESLIDRITKVKLVNLDRYICFGCRRKVGPDFNIKMSIDDIKTKTKENRNLHLSNSQLEEIQNILQGKTEELLQHISKLEHFVGDFKSLFEDIEYTKRIIIEIINTIKEYDIDKRTGVNEDDMKSPLLFLNEMLVQGYNQNVDKILNLDNENAKQSLIEFKKLLKGYINSNSSILINKMLEYISDALKNFEKIYFNYHNVLFPSTDFDSEILKVIADDNYYNDKYQKSEKYDNEDNEDWKLYNEIVEYVVTRQSISASLLQRRFKLGYNKAAKFIDLLEERGIIGPANESSPRKVLVNIDKYY